MQLVRREGIQGLIQEEKAKVDARWDRHPSTRKLLQDHFPGIWTQIQHCRCHWKSLEWVQKPGWFRVAPIWSCWQEPYCINCSRASLWGRVNAAFEKLAKCTPTGEEPRFVHIVQTAPLTEDGQGWGLPASRNVPVFSKIVWGNLRQFYGEGTGAIMSYQDFGERPFAKRHPHLDLTLNGWMLKEGQPALTPRLDLTGIGFDAWHDALTEKAQALQLGAQRGSFNVQDLVVGENAYRHVLAYQMREMVDLTKFDYDARFRTLEWSSYKTPERQLYTLREFKAGLAEYQYRLKQWPRDGEEGMDLHRAFGHLAKGSLRKSHKAFGGINRGHGSDCPCPNCADWERVFEEYSEKGEKDQGR